MLYEVITKVMEKAFQGVDQHQKEALSQLLQTLYTNLQN